MPEVRRQHHMAGVGEGDGNKGINYLYFNYNSSIYEIYSDFQKTCFYSIVLK